MLPLLANGISTFFVFIYVLLARFNGPCFYLNAALFAPFD